MVSTRVCLSCGKDIEHKKSGAKYCGNSCLKRHKRQQKKAMSLGQKKGLAATAYKESRDLILEKIDDEVRDVLREEVRASISTRVRENVMGAAESITTLMPKAIAVFAADLESQDWMKRSKAAMYILKLGMPLINEDASKKDTGQVIIVHGVPMPDTTLGRRVAEEWDNQLEASKVGLLHPGEPYDPDNNPEVFEVDFPICTRCRERKHPDMIKRQGMCSTCHYREAIERGETQSLTADLDRVI